MRRILDIGLFVLLLGGIVFLFGFSNKRNDRRNLSKIEVKFLDANSPFITHEAVNKLLIQNVDSLTELSKEDLDLRSMEKRLEENPMIRKAEVFVTVDGALGAWIEQRDPIGRMQTSSGEAVYIDSDGMQMPLSSVYSARVPIVSGVSEEDLEIITPLLLKIREDEFMRRMVVGLSQQQNGDIQLDLRNTNLKANFGKPINIDKKFQNFRAFYNKTTQDSTIYGYSKINLKFESQVIATKK